MLVIANEKLKTYKKDLTVKDAQIAKEKAAVKYYKKEMDKIQADYDETVSELYELQVKLKHVEDENDRLTREYEYLRNTYGYERETISKVKVTSRYK